MGVRDEQLGALGGTELGAERPGPLGRERRPGGRGQQAAGTDHEAVDLRAADPGADQVRAGRVEQHVAGRRGVGQRDGRPGQRPQPAAGQAKAAVVAPAGAGVGHVHEAAADGDAHRLRPARCSDAGLPEPAVGRDREHRDLVAARVGGEQVATVVGDLDPALGPDRGTGAAAAGLERRAGGGRQRAVGVSVEHRDRIERGSVVVDVDVADGGGGGRRGSHRQGGEGGEGRARPDACEHAHGGFLSLVAPHAYTRATTA